MSIMIDLKVLDLNLINPGTAIGATWLDSEKLISSYNLELLLKLLNF